LHIIASQLLPLPDDYKVPQYGILGAVVNCRTIARGTLLPRKWWK